MRKLACTMLAMLLILTSVAVAFASESETLTQEQLNERLKQAPDFYSAERLAEIEILKSDVEAYLNGPVTYEISGNKKLSVPLAKQINSYYCGPASARMVLLYGGKDYSQSTLANYMGTTSADGSYVYKVKECLNNYWSAGKYKYVSNSEISFGEGLVYSIDKNRPLICHVMTAALPIYDSSSNYGHYVTAKGYEFKAVGATGYDRVYYNDPNYKSEFYGEHYSTWSAMRTAINNNAGLYIMAS